MEQEDLLERLTLEHDNALQKAREDLAGLRDDQKREDLGIIEKRRDAEDAAW